MSDEGEPFPGELFPSSYLVVYCPLKSCPLEEPFKEACNLLEHLKFSHNILIHNSAAVLPFLDRYLTALAENKRFDNLDKASIITIGSNDPEDCLVRDQLQQKVLKEILEIQKKERLSIHKRPRQCVFCMEYSPSLRDLFAHMFQVHHFNIGLLDNLVMVEEFLANLEGLLIRRICIYCHQVFRSVSSLKRHMKNKRHYKIDAKNHHYDKFYVVNYLKCGTLASTSKADHATEIDLFDLNNEDDDWEDLDEELDRKTACLFCSEVFPNPGYAFMDHFREAHNIDWRALRCKYLVLEDSENESSTGDHSYDYIKIVTYFRSTMQELCCPYCRVVFETQESLEKHLAQEGHCRLPDRHLWDKPEYMFPLFDDDPLLFDFQEDS